MLLFCIALIDGVNLSLPIRAIGAMVENLVNPMERGMERSYIFPCEVTVTRILIYRGQS
jgi:hypothetical protein